MRPTAQTRLRRPRRVAILWGALTVAGVVLIAAPDPDDRILSLSDGHGPGVVDAIGAVCLTVAWVALDWATWARRGRLHLSIRAWVTLSFAAAVAAVVGAWSVLADAGAWWMLAAAGLAAIQVVLAARVGVFAA